MSEWRVSLSLSEGSSNKFWRARIEGTSLFVNWGRIGTGGQTQVKELASEDAAEKELAKLEREKRKKGYDDWSEEGGAIEEAPAPPIAVVPAAAPIDVTRLRPIDYSYDAGGRRVALKLEVEGNSLRTVVVEEYESAEAAGRAFERMAAAMETEGYRRA